jgi:heparanase 1
MCDNTRVKGCVPIPYNGPVTVNIDSTKVLGRTNALSPAVTLDFWRFDDPRFGQKWNRSGAIEIDLQNPQLRSLAKALSPAILRLGGSPEDSIVFDTDGTCVPQSGGDGPFKNYFCSQVHPYVYDCLTEDRWNDLLHFAQDTGLKIALGLNGCYGRSSPSSSMDLSNIKLLLTATARSPYYSALWGFEFTNEVVPRAITPEAWAKDLTAIQKLAVQIFKAANRPVPPFVGPDQGNCLPIQDVAPFLPPGVVTAYTYHQYPQCTAPSPRDGFLMDPSCLLQLDSIASTCAATAKNYTKGPTIPAVWAGETADHSGGGIPNLTDTFRSSFYYAWQLGALPGNGVELAARQCLSGGDYELLQRVTFNPNPDYFIIWLFHSLIGGSASAYEVTQSIPASTTGVRVFALTASSAWNASMTLIAINLQDGSLGGSAPITLTGSAAGRQRIEYHLSADPTVPHGLVTCNGLPLRINSRTLLPPPIGTLGVVAQGVLNIAAGSVVFATVF